MARRYSEEKLKELQGKGVPVKDAKGKDIVPMEKPKEVEKPDESSRVMATVTGVITSFSTELVKSMKSLVHSQAVTSKALVDSQNSMVEKVVNKIDEVKAIKLPDPPKVPAPIMKEFSVVFIKNQNDSMTGMTVKQTK